MRQLLRALVAALSAALLVACGSEQVVQFTATEPPEPASVRLFFTAGEVTQHVPLNNGQTHRIEVRLFAANGTRITGYDDHFDLTVDFTPTSLAVAVPVAGRPLLKDLTASASPEESGTIHISFYHAHTMTTRTFGPFEALVH